MPDNNQKSYNPSRDFKVLKLNKQITRYIFDGDDYARAELLNQKINGETLAEALGPIRIYIKELSIKENMHIKELNIKESINNEKNKIKSLISDLEKITKAKNGAIIKEIKKTIDEYK